MAQRKKPPSPRPKDANISVRLAGDIDGPLIEHLYAREIQFRPKTQRGRNTVSGIGAYIRWLIQRDMNGENQSGGSDRTSQGDTLSTVEFRQQFIDLGGQLLREIIAEVRDVVKDVSLSGIRPSEIVSEEEEDNINDFLLSISA